MSKYADIIERLEKATGPDRDLDYWIYDLVVHRASSGQVRLADLLPHWTEAQRATCIPAYTDNLNASVGFLKHALPGWGWRGGSCHLSDDCFVFPDYNCQEHGERLKREFSVKIDGQEWSDYTDIDMRPAGRLPIAILLSIFTALDGIEKLKGVKP